MKRGLERLRRGLAGGGFAVLAADVEEALAAHAAADAPEVPAALASRLLALESGSAATAASLPALAAGVLLVAAAAALLLVAPEPPPTEPPAPRVAAAAADDAETRFDLDAALAEGEPLRLALPAAPATSSAAPATALPPAAALPNGRIDGTVVDADGRPLPGLKVRARSAVLAGKGSHADVSDATDTRGAFSIQVPVRHEDGETYALLVLQDGVLLPAPPTEVVARPGAAADAGTLSLETPLPETRGASTLHLTLLDEDGVPLRGARCRLHRRVPRHFSTPLRAPEAEGETDVDGRVTLATEWLGPKRLDVLPAAPHPVARSADLDVDAPGTHHLTLHLDARPAIAGTLFSLDGPPLEGTTVNAFRADDPNRWHHATVDAAGRFSFDGLAPGLHTVRVEAAGHDPLTLDDVPCGRTDLAIVLKRRGDVRDLGTHRAELHGHARAAADGRPVAMRWPELQAFPVPDGVDRDAFHRDFLPNHVWPPPVQTAFGPHVPPKTADFHLVDLAAGRYGVRYCDVRGGFAYAGPFDLAEGEIVRDVLLTVVAPADLEGTVVDGRGRPVPRALVLVTGTGPTSEAAVAAFEKRVAETRGEGAFPEHCARADADGRFRFPALAPQLPLRLAAVHGDHPTVRSGVVPLRAGETAEVTLRMW